MRKACLAILLVSACSGDAAAGSLGGGNGARVPCQIVGIIGTGQSNSVGSGAAQAPITTAQPYSNLMFSAVITPATLTSVLPLVEAVSETHSASMANYLYGLRPGVGRYLVSQHGVSGTGYSGLALGQTPYTNSIAAVTAGKARAAEMGCAYKVAAVTVVHGENDLANASYAANMATWQDNYDASVKAVTGQSEEVIMAHWQIGSAAAYQGAGTTNDVAVRQLAAARANPGEVILVGAGYNIAYGYGDYKHHNQAQYAWIGSYFAKALSYGGGWLPLSPTAIVRAGANIDVTYHVPVGCITLDTTNVSAQTNSGFEFYDASGSTPTITSVTVTGCNTIRVALSGTPAGPTEQLCYAYDDVTGLGRSGPTQGARGNVRDDDAALDHYGNHLWDWAATSCDPVPYP